MDRRKLKLGMAGLLLISFAWGAQLSAKPGAAPVQRGVQWHHDLQAAHKLAIASNKPLLIVFGSPWCGNCQKLELETLADPALAKFVNTEFIAVHQDFDKDHRVAEIFEVKSLPTSVILNSDADLLGTIVGFVGTSECQKSLRKALEVDRLTQAAAELQSDAAEVQPDALLKPENEPAPSQTGESSGLRNRNRIARSAKILPVRADQGEKSQLPAWLQEPESLEPAFIQTADELQPFTPQPQTEPLPAAGAAPTLAGDSYYLGDPGAANTSNGYADNSNNGGYGGYYGGNGGRVWGSASVLLWWIKQGSTPPLVTSGLPPSTGALGPGTTTITGSNQDYNMRTGGLFTLGGWLNSSQTMGVEGSYFFLNGPTDHSSTTSSGAPGSPVIARPFTNAITGLPDSQLVAFPGVLGGTVQTTSSSQLQGAQLNMLCNLCCCNVCPTCCSPGYGYNVNLIGGFTYLQLNENLVITENITVLPTAPPPFILGQMITVVDQFQTRNNFYGSNVGVRAEWWRGRWFVNTTTQVALGVTHQQVNINGMTTFTDPNGMSVTQPGGLLALPTNSGTFSRDQFTAIPQVGFNVGRQVTDHMRIFAGYTLLYWSNVARPGDQIDPVINPTQLPTAAGPGTLVGPARPAPGIHDSSLWAQGVNLGVGFTW